MKKTLKYVLLAAAAGLGVFLLFLAYLLVTVNPNDYKPRIVNLVREETHRTLDLEGDIGLKLFPRIGLNLGKASLSGPGGKGEFASVGNAVLDVAWLPLLHGGLEIDRVDVDGLRVGLIRYKDGTTNFDDLKSGNGAGGKKPEYDIGGIEVKNSSVSFEDEKTGQRTALENISLRTGRLKEGVRSDLSLGFDMRSGNSTARLDLKSGLRMEPEKYSFDNIDLKYSGEKLSAAVRGAVEIDTKKEAVSADLSSTFDESHAKAKFSVTNFSSPAYRFDVSVDRIDADRYLSGKKDSGPEKPFDLSFLKNLNADGKLSVGSIRFHGLQLSNFALAMKAADSRLVLDPLSADLYQGKANGSLAIQALSVPKFSVRERLSGVSIGPLIRDMTKKDVLEGRGEVSADLNASGNLVMELKKSLSGKASLRLTDGAVRGIDIAAILRGLRSRNGTASSSEKTDFSDLSATFDIRNGVAHNSDLSAKSPLLRLGGEGDIDIGRSSVNYLAKVSVVATLEGQGGAGLSSLKGVTVPVRISGPFDSLHYSLDVASMASGAVKAKIEQKKTEIRNKVQDELMKGIFGR